MRLYLSSYLFGDSASTLRSMASGPAAMVIANALDFTEDIPRKEAGTAREITGLTSLGFSARELDLRTYFGQPTALSDQLAGVALLWVMGGNAFLLRRALRLSGLDDYLLARRGDPTLVYGGYSAGAIVATPTLRGIELVDPPNATAAGYSPEILWEGLGLVPYSLAPHYQSNHPESAQIDDVVSYFIDHQMPFQALRDGEVIVTDA